MAPYRTRITFENKDHSSSMSQTVQDQKSYCPPGSKSFFPQSVKQIKCRPRDCKIYAADCHKYGVGGSAKEEAACTSNNIKSECESDPVTKTLVNAIANPCTPTGFHMPHTKSPRRSRRGASSDSVTHATITSSSSAASVDTSGSEEDSVSNPRETRLPRRISKGKLKPSSPGRPSQISVMRPPSSCDLIIAIGVQEFYYSASILGASSGYLESRVVKRDPDDRYYISFPFHSPDDWRVVKGFLQPRAIGAADLSWQTFPTVLPWFSEFGLHVLLKDADLFLLETIVVSQTEHDNEDVSIAIGNLLLLTNIGYGCCLELTMSRARQWLQSKLLQPQAVPQDFNEDSDQLGDEEVVLEWTLKDLQELSLLLAQFKDLRKYLWESSIIMYLPHDLSVEDSQALVSNPLFPYLLREGMMQLSIVKRAQLVIDHQGRRDLGSISPALTSSSEITMPTNHLAAMTKERLTDNLLNVLLQTTNENLDKFKRNKEMGEKALTSHSKKDIHTKRRERRRIQKKQQRRSDDIVNYPGDERIIRIETGLHGKKNGGRTFEC